MDIIFTAYSNDYYGKVLYLIISIIVQRFLRFFKCVFKALGTLIDVSIIFS